MSWRSKKQGLVTTSTFLSEYVALGHTVAELLWLEGLFRELGVEMAVLPKIYEDNRGVALSVSGTGSNPSNNKLVDIKEKFIQKIVQRGRVIGTANNVVDMFNKALARISFDRHFETLGYDKHMIRAIRAAFTLERTLSLC